MVDQRRIDNQRKTISAAEAARRMGVQRRTIYAYAARGLLCSLPRQDGLAHDYLLEDVERLIARKRAHAGHGPAAAGALRYGEPVLETAVSDLDARGPIYRALPAVHLATTGVSFERTAELLWHGRLLERDPSWPRDTALLRLLPAPIAAARPLAQLTYTLATLGAKDGSRDGETRDATIALSRALLPVLAASLAPPKQRAFAFAEPRIADIMLAALGGRKDKRSSALVNQTLVLTAEHELNTSTFAARVAASAGADVYACLAAACAVASGPDHVGGPDRVEAFLAEIGEPKLARKAIEARLQRGDPIPGFGLRLYKDADPRAVPLFSGARSLAPRDRTVQRLFAAIDAMRALGREAPTLDTAVVAVAAAVGLPRGSAPVLFAIGRAAGWIAHVLEQRAAGYLLRPRARYVPTLDAPATTE